MIAIACGSVGSELILLDRNASPCTPESDAIALPYSIRAVGKYRGVIRSLLFTADGRYLICTGTAPYAAVFSLDQIQGTPSGSSGSDVVAAGGPAAVVVVDVGVCADVSASVTLRSATTSAPRILESCQELPLSSWGNRISDGFSAHARCSRLDTHCTHSYVGVVTDTGDCTVYSTLDFACPYITLSYSCAGVVASRGACAHVRVRGGTILVCVCLYTEMRVKVYDVTTVWCIGG